MGPMADSFCQGVAVRLLHITHYTTHWLNVLVVGRKGIEIDRTKPKVDHASARVPMVGRVFHR